MSDSFNLDNVYKFLLLSLAFFTPLTVFGANLIIVLIVVIWLFSGSYGYKYTQIISNKFLIASIIFFIIHAIGLLWTEDISWGFHILHKMWYFLLLLPVLHSIVKKKDVSLYISLFLMAITFTEIVSYLVWFEIIPPFRFATVLNPTPFMSHVSYNPILTISIYIVLHGLFFNRKIEKLRFFLYSFFAITMTINMFITGGRAGQVMYFVMISIFIFQYFNHQKIKSLFAVLIIVPIIFATAYQTSPLFHKRVNLAVNNTLDYSVNKNTSVGQRITFAINSWEVIKENPIIGVGTGDFPNEYQKVNTINTPDMPDTKNPHNMYTLILVQLGFLGLVSMLSIFYYQLRISLNQSDKFFRDMGVTLPLLFLVIMLSDSYLLGHYTTLVYVLFSSFLYKDFEKS
jgi:O-antigen ligase